MVALLINILNFKVDLGGAVVEGTIDIQFPSDATTGGASMVVDFVPTGAETEEIRPAPPPLQNVTIVDAPKHQPDTEGQNHQSGQHR